MATALFVKDVAQNVRDLGMGLITGDGERAQSGANGLIFDAAMILIMHQTMKAAFPEPEPLVTARAPKRVPNPDGKLGSPGHRGGVTKVVENIKSRGLVADTEVTVRTVNGAKATRVMDVVARDPATQRIVEVHQVGHGFKSNPLIPVARERTALRDVRHSPELRGAKRYFHNFDE